MDAATVQEKALAALVAITEDKDVRVEVRVEAAKVILNRPRHFIAGGVTEA
jgi:hypothetical protein